MHATDILWWSFTLFLGVTALLMIIFVLKVRKKGD